MLEGSDFKLVCNYSDSAIFSWERIGTAPPSFTQVLQLSSTSSQVLISNARHGLHSGQYRCVANTTSTGHVEVSPTFNITINCEWLMRDSIAPTSRSYHLPLLRKLI